MKCTVLGVPIYYEAYGEGKPVLCLHGFAVDHRLMSGCLEPVFSRMEGYRRIYLDLPGMGQTPGAPQAKNADRLLEILVEFSSAVMPGEKFLVIGESYGGYLALGMVHAIPNRIDGAMLICPVTLADRGARHLPEKRLLWQGGHFDAPDDFWDMAVMAAPDIYEAYNRDISSGVALADGDYLAEYEKGYGFSFEGALLEKAYERPVCVLTGRQDHVTGYADAFAALRALPRATFAALDCAGHNLQIENPPLLALMLKDWLWRTEHT